jgi:hypothetical protein
VRRSNHAAQSDTTFCSCSGESSRVPIRPAEKQQLVGFRCWCAHKSVLVIMRILVQAVACDKIVFPPPKKKRLQNSRPGAGLVSLTRPRSLRVPSEALPVSKPMTRAQ